MDTNQISEQAQLLRSRIQRYARQHNEGNLSAAATAQVCEFLRQFAGPKSAFTRQAEEAGGSAAYIVSTLSGILESYVEYLESGLSNEMSLERRAKNDVVSDFLEQADTLLATKRIHPAAPIVIIGAALEEFLRTWVETEELSLGNRKPSIDSYSKLLKEAELIGKQDVKDITSWAGLRNQAAHGLWDDVGHKQRAVLMMEGVNLFMRRYAT